MYQIFCDRYTLYDDSIEGLKLINPNLDLEVNKAGSFTFTILPSHPYYEFVKKMKPIITVYRTGRILFRGRVLNREFGFRNEKQVVCEGELAFFNDSIQRPYSFTGSVEDYFKMLVENHNSQVDEDRQFIVGNVTVTDANDYIVRADTECKKTWKLIEEKLIDPLGGYIRVRHEADGNYIDYLDDFNVISNQKVVFAKNLLDMKRTCKGETIATALIPLGAKIKEESEEETTEKRLTIESVNNGLDYVFNQEAVDAYGWIWTTETWDDVTEPQNLLNKANARIGQLAAMEESIELSAADLATAGTSVNSFNIGTYVTVETKPHGIEGNFLVRKLSLALLQPAANKLTLGITFSSLTDTTHKTDKDQGSLLDKIEKVEINLNTSIPLLEKNLETLVQTTSEGILSSVSEQYVLKGEVDDAVVQEVSTQIQQTKDEVNIIFSEYSADLKDLQDGMDAEFETIKKYIRFVDGKILLGEVGNELELQIAHDRISFLQNNAEVAYFSNNKLFVTDGEYTNSLTLGNFAFIPRANGNLSFKKIT